MLAAPDGDDEDDTPSAAKASDGDRKKGKRRPRVLLELFVADAPTAQAWAQRAVLQQELFFGEVSTQLDIPLARLGSYAAKDIDSVATDFRTAEGSPLLSVKYCFLQST